MCGLDIKGAGGVHPRKAPEGSGLTFYPKFLLLPVVYLSSKWHLSRLSSKPLPLLIPLTCFLLHLKPTHHYNSLSLLQLQLSSLLLPAPFPPHSAVELKTGKAQGRNGCVRASNQTLLSLLSLPSLVTFLDSLATLRMLD